MLPILILLYVLDTGNIIPTECYIAAWIFTIIQLIGGIYEWKKMKGGGKMYVPNYNSALSELNASLGFGVAYSDYLSRVLKRKHYGQTHKYRK